MPTALRVCIHIYMYRRADTRNHNIVLCIYTYNIDIYVNIIIILYSHVYNIYLYVRGRELRIDSIRMAHCVRYSVVAVVRHCARLQPLPTNGFDSNPGLTIADAQKYYSRFFNFNFSD